MNLHNLHCCCCRSTSVTMATWQSITSYIDSMKQCALFVLFYSDCSVSLWETRRGELVKWQKCSLKTSVTSWLLPVKPIYASNEVQVTLALSHHLHRVSSNQILLAAFTWMFTQFLYELSGISSQKCLSRRTNGGTGGWDEGWGWAEGDKLTTWNVTPWVSPLVLRS